MLYDDLPEEIAEFFPVDDVAIPPILRAAITDGWDIMEMDQQKQLVEKIKVVKAPVQRALIAIFETAKVLLTQPPEDIVY